MDHGQIEAAVAVEVAYEYAGVVLGNLEGAVAVALVVQDRADATTLGE